MKKLILLAALVACSFHGFAQGTAFTYQGRLNSGGNVATGNYDLQFSLWSAASGPAQLGSTLTNAATPVSNGLFTVTLDFGANFPGADRWLEIGVRTNGGGGFTTLSPRQLITSVPYSIRAASYSGAVAASQLTGSISSNNISAGSITTVMLAAGAVGSNQLASGAVTTAALADSAVTAMKISMPTNTLLLGTFVNPTPAIDDWFGYSVAAIGNDRVLIGARNDDTGATDAGAAYLFKTDGTLLMTFTNPTPAGTELFGGTVSAFGTDRVLIASINERPLGTFFVGLVYLYSTNGTELMTFNNPNGGTLSQFGISMAALGSDRVLIGAPQDDTGALNTGAAFLFSTNGTDLMTFTNPTPATDDNFGYSVAAIGTDRVLIGAYGDDTAGANAGAAYLFSTNGFLLMTFTNAIPGANFGAAVAGLGSDRVLIGAYGAGIGGTAYLFNTNGTLLTTFTNPTPVGADLFGVSIVALGNDRVLIGAPLDDAGGPDVGAVYLFNTNGILLHTFTNPTPAALEGFGNSVAAVGNDRVLIGAYQDDAGATNSGVAHLLALQSYTPGLVVDGVRGDAIATVSLADGAVTAAKLDPSIGVWSRSGSNVYRSLGSVGIGASSPADTLEVAGTIRGLGYRCRTGTGGSYSTHQFDFEWTGSALQAWVDNVNVGTVSLTSDRRLKEDIEPMRADALDRVLALKPSTFKYKDIAGGIFTGDGETKEGFIADELQAVIPSAVVGAKEATTPDGQIQPQTLNALPLVAVLTKAVQELTVKVEAWNQESIDRFQKLEKELKGRDAENAELRKRLEKLEQRLGDVSSRSP